MMTAVPASISSGDRAEKEGLAGFDLAVPRSRDHERHDRVVGPRLALHRLGVDIGELIPADEPAVRQAEELIEVAIAAADVLAVDQDGFACGELVVELRRRR